MTHDTERTAHGPRKAWLMFYAPDFGMETALSFPSEKAALDELARELGIHPSISGRYTPGFASRVDDAYNDAGWKALTVTTLDLDTGKVIPLPGAPEGDLGMERFIEEVGILAANEGLTFEDLADRTGCDVLPSGSDSLPAGAKDAFSFYEPRPGIRRRDGFVAFRALEDGSVTAVSAPDPSFALTGLFVRLVMDGEVEPREILDRLENGGPPEP